jgi:hypothetical protein
MIEVSFRRDFGPRRNYAGDFSSLLSGRGPASGWLGHSKLVGFLLSSEPERQQSNSAVQPIEIAYAYFVIIPSAP